MKMDELTVRCRVRGYDYEYANLNAGGLHYQAQAGTLVDFADTWDRVRKATDGPLPERLDPYLEEVMLRELRHEFDACLFTFFLAYVHPDRIPLANALFRRENPPPSWILYALVIHRAYNGTLIDYAKNHVLVDGNMDFPQSWFNWPEVAGDLLRKNDLMEATAMFTGKTWVVRKDYDNYPWNTDTLTRLILNWMSEQNRREKKA